MGMYLPYFEKNAFDNLYNNVSHNSTKYAGSQEWLKEYFSGEKYITESTIEVPDVTLEFADKKLSIEELNAQDYTNAVMLHSSYRGIITPQIATNKYMWTALAHTTFYEYVQSRWREQDIKERFFSTGGRQSINYYNAISRLWWIGELTYDEKQKYKYTEILLESGQQTWKDLTDCTFSANKKVTRGIIKAVYELKNEGRVFNFGDCFRDLNKYLNRQGAIYSLDFMEEEEITQLALEYMLKWQKAHTKTADSNNSDIRQVSGAQERSVNDAAMSLKSFFESRGLTIADRRPSGCLWVIGEEITLAPHIKAAEKAFGVKGGYSIGKTIGNKHGWWTKDPR